MQRERPMQNSMILPDNSASGKRSSFDYSMMPGMAKSSMFNNTEQQPRQMMTNQARSPQQFMPFQPESPNFNRSHSGLEKIIFDINEKLERISRIVDKHQNQLSSFSLEGDMTKKLITELRQSMPSLNSNGDIAEQLFNMKLDIKAMGEEIDRMPKFKDLQKISVQKYQDKTNSSVTSENYVSQEMLTKRDEVLEKTLRKLDSELIILKKNINNMKIQMKVSPISSPSCIMLKYQELFKARNKNQTDMIISEITYYIDNDGFLLDCHSRYIVDQKGKKIRLQEKHIAMLRNQKVLQ